MIFNNLRKNFCACDRTWAVDRVWTTSSICFQFFPKAIRANLSDQYPLGTFSATRSSNDPQSAISLKVILLIQVTWTQNIIDYRQMSKPSRRLQSYHTPEVAMAFTTKPLIDQQIGDLPQPQSTPHLVSKTTTSTVRQTIPRNYQIYQKSAKDSTTGKFSEIILEDI